MRTYERRALSLSLRLICSQFARREVECTSLDRDYDGYVLDLGGNVLAWLGRARLDIEYKFTSCATE